MKPGIFPFTASGDTSPAVNPNSKERGSAGLMLPRPSCRKDPSKYNVRFGDGGTLLAGRTATAAAFPFNGPAEAARRACGHHPDDLPASSAIFLRMTPIGGALDTLFRRDLSAAATLDIDDG